MSQWEADRETDCRSNKSKYHRLPNLRRISVGVQAVGHLMDNPRIVVHNSPEKLAGRNLRPSVLSRWPRGPIGQLPTRFARTPEIVPPLIDTIGNFALP